MEQPEGVRRYVGGRAVEIVTSARGPAMSCRCATHWNQTAERL